MPLSDFVPLIGSGFDSLANQRLQWETFNRGIEEANLARATAAETRQDNWLAQVAKMNQQREEENFQRQMDADAYGRQLALQRESEATRQRERTEDIKREGERFTKQMEYGKSYLDTQQKIADEKIAAAAKNKELTLDAQGQHLAANYLGLQRNHEAAQQALEDLHKQIDATQTALEAKKLDPQKKIDLNNRLKLYTQSLRQREADARKAESDFERLKNRADNARFEINDDGTITHPDTSKTWSWKKALQAAKAGQQYTGPIGPTLTTETPETGAADATPAETGMPAWGGFVARPWETQPGAAIIPQMSAPPEGTLVRNKRTGQLARVVGGEAVTFGGSNAN